MHPQQIQPVRSTHICIAPLARHVDESAAVMPATDSVALHRWAREQRSRMLGNIIARAVATLATWAGRALHVVSAPSTKRSTRADVI